MDLKNMSHLSRIKKSLWRHRYQQNTPLLRLLRRAGSAYTACDSRTTEALGTCMRSFALGGQFRWGTGSGRPPRDVHLPHAGLHPETPGDGGGEKGRVITSEMEAFFEVCPCRIVASRAATGSPTPPR
jgi:UDP-N-acetylmuramoylalanine--D-glutamate ligase